MKRKKKLGEINSAVSHALGALIGIFSLVIMILKVEHKTHQYLIPIIVYNIGFIMLYTFSAIYHFFPNGKCKSIFRKFDHISTDEWREGLIRQTDFDRPVASSGCDSQTRNPD